MTKENQLELTKEQEEYLLEEAREVYFEGLVPGFKYEEEVK